jgi:lipid-binding SYLF domain-containing protein
MHHTPRTSGLRVLAFALPLLLVGAPARAATSKVKELRPDVERTLSRFKRTDPGIKRLVDSAAGYAVFPRIGKGGFLIGGAGGSGLVYEGGRVVGVSRMTQITVGAQVGGQVYSMLLFFRNKAALGRFKSSRFDMSAQTGVIAAAEGAARNARWDQDMMVFTLPVQGLMAEASIGGQRFQFTPVSH